MYRDENIWLRGYDLDGNQRAWVRILLYIYIEIFSIITTIINIFQVKFFIIALIGLGINLARFWVELKNKHNQQPQKVE